MLASQLQLGHVVPGFGPVESLKLNFGDKAVMRPTVSWGIQIRPAVRINGLLRSRLAQEAVEHTYERVPVSITVTSGDGRRIFDIEEEIEVKSEVKSELLAAA
jgi:hypothetical protein